MSTTVTITGHTTLHVTDALPMHYVADVPGEGQWLLPATLLFGSPEKLWAAAKPYRGNHTLRRAVPAEHLEVYAQPPADWPER